ncbi:MAG: hypothetical protein QNJ31_02910 [Candidatus Caenarcaniphilales bacterium]|nr:hypothetical protein [Candidatus Caenarcaniphilales bacterium]
MKNSKTIKVISIILLPVLLLINGLTANACDCQKGDKCSCGPSCSCGESLK